MALSKITNASVADTAVHGRRNLVINGAMQVAQRGTSASAANGYTVMDRFRNGAMGNLDNLAVTKSQSSTSPDGFSNSLKFVATTAESAVAANERFVFLHRIEAQNLQHLQFGTSNAKTTTLSFWVRSNVTGNYGLSLYQSDGNRITGDTYTISSADTWEHKSITFVGDTGGTVNNDTGIGLEITWYLLAGTDFTGTDNSSWATYSSGTEAYGHTADWGQDANDDFYITGVQLEVGEASPFEHRSYAEELLACQRYYHQANSDGHSSPMEFTRYRTSSNNYTCEYVFPVEMRANPTVTNTIASNGYHKPGIVYEGGTFTANNGTVQYKHFGVSPTTNHTDCTVLWIQSGNVKFDAEL